MILRPYTLPRTERAQLWKGVGPLIFLSSFAYPPLMQIEEQNEEFGAVDARYEKFFVGTEIFRPIIETRI